MELEFRVYNFWCSLNVKSQYIKKGKKLAQIPTQNLLPGLSLSLQEQALCSSLPSCMVLKSGDWYPQ
jgi:hypothetical protein